MRGEQNPPRLVLHYDKGLLRTADALILLGGLIKAFSKGPGLLGRSPDQGTRRAQHGELRFFLGHADLEAAGEGAGVASQRHGPMAREMRVFCNRAAFGRALTSPEAVPDATAPMCGKVWIYL